MDTDDDDVEYEEIEEEIEVEVEEEDHDEDEEEEFPVLVRDVSEARESHGFEDHLVSDCFGPVYCNSNKFEFLTANESRFEAHLDVRKSHKSGMPLAASGDVEYSNGRTDSVASAKGGQQKKIDANNGASPDCGIVIAEAIKPLIVSGEESVAAIFPSDGFTGEANDVVEKAETEKLGKQSREDVCGELASVAVPQIRLRSLSPVNESNDMNKRQAVICNFFAKGWCIKGNSCKFLHIKDDASIVRQTPECYEAMLEGKNRLQPDIGLGDELERSQSNSFMAANSSPSFRRSPLLKDLYKDSAISISSSRDSRVDNLKPDSSDDCLINRNHQSGFGLSALTSRMFPSLSSSSWTSAPLSLSFLDKDPLIASGSSSLFRSSADPLPFGTGNASDDWEPSVPFRPSFPFTKNLLAPFALYDPILDSIEQPKIGDKFPNFSSRPETSFPDARPNIDNDHALPSPVRPKYGSYNHSISNHHSADHLPDKYFDGRYSLSSEEEYVDTLKGEQSFRHNLPKEGSISEHVQAKENAEVKEGIHDSKSKHREDGIINEELDFKMDSQKNEKNLNPGRDGEQRQSRAMKHFRVALIDFIKELVKPSWLDGHLSKDAHKVVVKKAVEKVLSTVQPHQAPSTEELVDHYLSTSRPKISKLVEGYVVKYGKS